MTMRSAENIPPMTDYRYKTYQLQGLPENDCWSMIKKTAFGHGGAKETADLINIGMQIAIKCGGLPLAAKTLGNLLYSRETEDDWLLILRSPIWNLPTDENKIISILKLSYDHLSPYVKRCFSYCSIFPKGHYFLKKELILMWMAEGFLNSPRQPNAIPETVGKDYLKILLLNSFFQDEKRKNEKRKNKVSGDIKFCRMHDLVHDLAISVAGSEYRVVKMITGADKEVVEQSNKFRRLGLHVHSDVSEIPSEIFKASKLRTFASFNQKYDPLPQNYLQIFNFNLLRVVNLSHTAIIELPKVICTLKHLRYLDLSYTKIQTFPSSFSQLYNLQTLRLKDCYYLEDLPKDMTKLISLEYFSFSGPTHTWQPSFTRMPIREVSRLSKLKKLSGFTVADGKGYGIEELKDLNLLGGKLIIRNLERVTDGTQANLAEKKNITHLQLHWVSPYTSKDPDRINKDINDLQPHRNLKRIEIHDFGGSNLPTWMMSTSIHLPNLVHINLEVCPDCEHLPALGRLRSLRYLSLSAFQSITHIGDEFYQSNEEASFPSLVEFRLFYLPNLEEWIGDQRAPTSSFPCLETLEIKYCDQLSATPTTFPSLKNLTFGITHCTKFLPLKLLRGASVLQTILVNNNDVFEGFLPDDVVQQHYQPGYLCNNFLFRIEILGCPSLTRLPEDFRGLNSLTYLAIQDCGSLTSLPDGIQYLPALRKLLLGGFSKDLVSFPFPAANGSVGEQYFVSLRELTICGWPSLRDVLPNQLQFLTSLQHLNIKGFPCLLTLREWFGELSSLETLGIENCDELRYLPSEEQMLRLTALQELDIWSCPHLQERCFPGNEESHKIAYLKLTKASPSHSKYERDIFDR